MPPTATWTMSHTVAPLRRRSRSSLADLAYEAIVEAIFEGHLPPATPLTIDALARDLTMSNTPLREALTRLTAERLVVFSANRGYRVAPRLTEAGYHHLFEVRSLFELHALGGDALDPAVADRLAATLDQMEAVDPGPDYRAYKTFNQADRAFHRALVGMSDNEFLIRAWTDLHFHLHVGRLYAGAGIIDHDAGGREHRTILAALRAGDQAEVIRRDALHIQRAERRLAPLLEPTRSPPPRGRGRTDHGPSEEKGGGGQEPGEAPTPLRRGGAQRLGPTSGGDGAAGDDTIR